MTPDSVVVKIREFIVHGLRILPIVLASFAFILGVGQGNMAFFFLFIGLALVVPILNLVSNSIFSMVLGKLPDALYKIKAPAVGGCAVFGEFASAGDVTSYWLAALVFFVSYMFINAYNLYNRPSAPNAPENKVEARKTQAAMAMAIIVLFAIGMVLYRFLATGCESPMGLPVALAVFIPAAYYWYDVLVSCSGDRLTDLFGAANRIMTEPSSAGAGAVCMPVA
jgi:magnesium-transporting ATPase (P-type)